MVISDNCIDILNSCILEALQTGNSDIRSCSRFADFVACVENQSNQANEPALEVIIKNVVAPLLGSFAIPTSPLGGFLLGGTLANYDTYSEAAVEAANFLRPDALGIKPELNESLNQLRASYMRERTAEGYADYLRLLHEYGRQALIDQEETKFESLEDLVIEAVNTAVDARLAGLNAGYDVIYPGSDEDDLGVIQPKSGARKRSTGGSSLADDIIEMSEQLVSLTTDYTQLRTDITTADGRADTEVPTLSTRMNALEDSLKQYQESLATLSSSVLGHNTQIDELAARISGLVSRNQAFQSADNPEFQAPHRRADPEIV